VSDGVVITDVDTFAVDLPCAPQDIARGAYHRYVVVRLRTDAGVTGYSFAGPHNREQWPRVREILLGQDLFAVDRHLRSGLDMLFGAEHAVWDAIGRLMGRPAYDLLGGARTTRVPAYVTVVWEGPLDQTHVSIQDIAGTVRAYQTMGFRGAKIRCWRPDHARVCLAIREAVGDDFAIMVDRTAHLPGHTWSYDEALAAGKALQEAGVLWLEEPMDRADLAGQARLRDELELMVVGGEGYTSPAQFAAAIGAGAFDALQPDAGVVGGILPSLRVAALAEASGVPLIPHGQGGLRLAGWLQVAALVAPAWQELALIPAPLHPDEAWASGTSVLTTDHLYRIEDGEIVIPEGPGLGLPVDEDAVERYRVG
jgi:D-galactarolactone cycloisomerase